MKLKAEMYLCSSDLRRACIDNNWCDVMTNKQYYNMLDICNNSLIMTLNELIEISRRITYGTNRTLCIDDVLNKLLNGGYIIFNHYVE